MVIEQIHPSGICLVTPDRIFQDHRGTFLETHHSVDVVELFRKAGMPTKDVPDRFVQANLSLSAPFVLRGMHYQSRGRQGKLIRCVGGNIYQVSIDVREGSETFGQWIGVQLNAITHQAVFVPPGFANGFLAMQNGATVQYEMTANYVEKLDRALAWNDPTVGIKWPFGVNASGVLSAKDRAAPRLDEIEKWTP